MVPSQPGSRELDEIHRRIIGLVAKGWTDQRIARELAISVSTVRRRVHAAAEALGANSRVALAVTATRLGLLDDVSSEDELEQKRS